MTHLTDGALRRYVDEPQALPDDERGHPRLRMRHMPFHIGAVERDHWLMHMAAAIEATAPSDEVATELLRYFVPAAEHLRNDTGLPISSSRPN